MFCVIPQVICVHDVSSIYRVPLLLESQGVVGYFCTRLDLPVETRARKMLTKWKEMSDRWEGRSHRTTFALRLVVWVPCFSLVSWRK